MPEIPSANQNANTSIEEDEIDEEEKKDTIDEIRIDRVSQLPIHDLGEE